MNQTDTITRLRQGSEILHATRLRRIARRPFRIAYPYLLERLGVETPILVDTFFGRKMKVVLPEGISVRIWRYGVFEEDVAFYLLSVLRPSDTFMDVGTHFGFFSMLAREITGAKGTVVSFEPMPSQRAILEENMAKHSAPCTHHLIPAAAGATAGHVKFKDFGILGSAFATSKEGRDARFALRGEVDVDVRTVDSVTEELGLTNLRLMKIDAENSEHDVLIGSLDTIRKLRPAIILEAGDTMEGATRRAVDVLLAENYTPYEFSDWSLRPHTISQRYDYQNLLMVPAEKTADMTGSR
jgi:FkbM family methyltransferase